MILFSYTIEEKGQFMSVFLKIFVLSWTALNFGSIQLHSDLSDEMICTIIIVLLYDNYQAWDMRNATFMESRQPLHDK